MGKITEISNGNDLMNLPYNFQTECEKDWAVINILQACCYQQLGCCDIAPHFYTTGKQIIGKYFDDIDSANITVAMKFMADYLLGEGEKKKAIVMINSVRARMSPSYQQWLND